MKVSQLMQRDVVTISPDASLKEAAAVLVEHGISGLPVCLPDGRVVGVVSEADILVKEQGIATGVSVGLVGRILEQAYGDAERLDAMTVRDAMTTPVITIESREPVSVAAGLMTSSRVKRLPVVDGNRLVGIVTRADLVRAFVRSDDEIEQEIRDDVLLDTLWMSPSSLAVEVEGGVVTVRGHVETETLSEIASAYVRRVPGVVSVRSELVWDVDDLTRRRRILAGRLPRRV